MFNENYNVVFLTQEWRVLYFLFVLLFAFFLEVKIINHLFWCLSSKTSSVVSLTVFFFPGPNTKLHAAIIILNYLLSTTWVSDPFLFFFAGYHIIYIYRATKGQKGYNFESIPSFQWQKNKYLFMVSFTCSCLWQCGLKKLMFWDNN